MSAEGTEVGGYRLLREIGRGGFGSVHLAEAPGGGLAAVKLLHVDSDADPRFARMFAAEVDAARRISPFCLAQVLDADPHADQPWIASEYIEGRTLAEEIRTDGPRTGADLQRLAVSTATALTAIHRAGIVHRDLKPENIMMAPDGPRVIDFGIARAFEETARFTATAKIGTLYYMAPERLDDAPHLTPAIDVFAWGAVIVYAASGRQAFSGDRQTAVIKRILMDEPDCAGVPDELRGLVTRCLAKNPEDRPSAHQLLNALLGPTADHLDVDTAITRGSTAVTRDLAQEEATLPRTLPYTRQVRMQGTQPPPPPAPEEPEAEGAEGAERKRRAKRPSDSKSPPYRFAGRLHHGVGELAEAMRADQDAAAAVFGDADERAALADWIIEDLEDTLVDRSLLRKPPKDPASAVLSFVSQARPDLPPEYRGLDMRLSALREGARRTPDPLDGTPDILQVPGEVLDVMAAHDCQDPDHGCPAGGGCAEYRRLLDDARAAMDSYTAARAPYLRWAGKNGLKNVGKSGFKAQKEAFVHALLTVDEWRGLVDEDRASLDEEWRAALPPLPPADTPQAERVAQGLLVRVLCRGIRNLTAGHEERSSRRKRLTAYVEAQVKANRTMAENDSWGWGLIVAAITFAIVGWAGVSSHEAPRIGPGLLAAFVVYGSIVTWVESAARSRARQILSRVEVPYPWISDPQERTQRAKTDVSSLFKEIRRLERAREELANLSRNT
ncbi:serine/threonine-protein kinase [Nocardiopsis sp. FIRDI 009]|uniref:serine/threonine-protein kinase n=1 Tax=Nocardiopsis sp. FIRDI 009 TaxID=714197 RepID=UPI000E225904|nr:serine/threonine-protein kinase [Nocardiopsis sp. FIRDI 009]